MMVLINELIVFFMYFVLLLFNLFLCDSDVIEIEKFVWLGLNVFC